MKLKPSTPLTAAILAGLVTVCVGGIAATRNDALDTTAPAVGLVQAVQAAEQLHSGRAVRAELELAGKPRVHVYDVEVVAGTQVFDVKVNAGNGAILSSREDKVDHDDDDQAD